MLDELKSGAKEYAPAAAIELGTSSKIPVTMHGKADTDEDT